MGILANTAVHSYQSSYRKSNRADAKISLNKLALKQERYYFKTNQYASDLTELMAGVNGDGTFDSDEGHYSIHLEASANAWSLTASSQGNQSKDHDCISLTLSNLGNKTALNSKHKKNPSCW